MATLYKRQKKGACSPFWWIKWIDDTGRLKQESTGKRIDSVQETRDARKIRASKEVIERGSAPADRKDRALSFWVDPWLVSSHKKDTTLEKYLGVWETFKTFFAMKGINSASEITREHCFQFLDWRQGLDNKNNLKKKNGGKVCRNTALHDLRILRKILFEAVKRQYIVQNPASKLGLKADVPDRKPEITDEERTIVETAFPELADWQEISWTIAINQGCRLSETSLPLSRVDFKGDKITFELKGGKLHTTKLMPAVKTLLLRLKEEGCTRTWAFHRLASRDWSRTFKNLGLNFSFHSTRVTVITKLARAGVNEQMARRFIGHASSEIHAIYTRLQADDLSSCVDALTSAPPKKGKPGQGGTRKTKKKIGRPTKTRRV
jgi:site-specific recombinase XerD